jgi:hypothetical protein
MTQETTQRMPQPHPMRVALAALVCGLLLGGFAVWEFGMRAAPREPRYTPITFDPGVQRGDAESAEEAQSSMPRAVPWWNGMGNPRAMPPRMGAAQRAPRLQGYATVLRR